MDNLYLRYGMYLVSNQGKYVSGINPQKNIWATKKLKI